MPYARRECIFHADGGKPAEAPGNEDMRIFRCSAFRGFIRPAGMLAMLACLSLASAADISDKDLSAALVAFLKTYEKVPEVLITEKQRVLQMLGPLVDGLSQDLQMLMEDLGAPEFIVREKATERLIELGPFAVDSVLDFKKLRSGDPEIAMRCDKIIRSVSVSDRPNISIQIVKFLLAAEPDEDTIRKHQQHYFEFLKCSRATNEVRQADKFQTLCDHLLVSLGDEQQIVIMLNDDSYNFHGGLKLALASILLKKDPDKHLLMIQGIKGIPGDELDSLVLQDDIMRKIAPQTLGEYVNAKSVDGDNDFSSQDFHLSNFKSLALKVLDLGGEQAVALSHKILNYLLDEEASGTRMAFDLNQVDLFSKMLRADPSLAHKLLILKGNWFFNEALKDSNPLIQAMRDSAGYAYNNSLCEIRDFYIENAAAVFSAARQQDEDSLALFPAAAVLSMSCIEDHQKEPLRKVLRNSQQEVMKHPGLREPLIVAAAALDFTEPAAGQAVLTLLSDPPKHAYFTEQALLSLDERFADLLPGLLEGHSKNPGNPLWLLAAMRVCPDSTEARELLAQTLLESDSRPAAWTAAGMLSLFNAMVPLEDIPKDRLEWLLDCTAEDDSYKLSNFLESIVEPQEQAELLKHLRTRLDGMASVSYYWTGLCDLFWRKPLNQRVIIDDIISLVSSDDNKKKALGVDMLASSPMAAASHVDKLHELLKQEQDDSIRKSMVWAISNIGQDAAVMRDTVKSISIPENYRLFCLANISPDPAERENSLDTLIREFRNSGDSILVRMVGLVRNQDNKTRPFLEDIIYNGILKASDTPSAPDSYVLNEAIWGISRNPDIHTWTLLFSIIEKASSNTLHPFADNIDSILWVFRTYYKDRLPQLQMPLRKLPLRYRSSKSFVKTLFLIDSRNSECSR